MILTILAVDQVRAVMTGLAVVVQTLAALSLASAAVLLVHFSIERKRVHRAVREWLAIADGAATSSIVLKLASAIHFSVPRVHDDPVFLHRLLEPLGGSPGQILRQGGCCSGRGRILIVAFDALGLRAGQLTLNHRENTYHHCIVEVWVDGLPALVDPEHGLHFVDQTGGPLHLEALQAHVSPRLLPLPGKETACYPDHPIYDWDYQKTGTMNWTKSLARRVAYRVLSTITRGGIDRWRQPVFLEWPQLVLASGLLAATLALWSANAFLLRP